MTYPTYQQIWCEHFVPCWISFTWPGEMFMIQILYKGWTMRSTSFISTIKYLFRRAFMRRSQRPSINTLLCTTWRQSMHSVHQMASVHLSQRISISRLSKNPGSTPIASRLSIRCSLQTSSSTNLLPLVPTFANRSMLNGTYLSGVLARLGDHSLFYDCISHFNISHCRGSS